MRFDEYTLSVGQRIESSTYTRPEGALLIGESLTFEVHKYTGLMCSYRHVTMSLGVCEPIKEKKRHIFVKCGKEGFIAANMAVEIDVVEKDSFGVATKVIIRVPRNGKKTLRNLQPV